jgi:hypothetical protein
MQEGICDTKGVSGTRKSKKGRQYNGQKKKRTNNNLQNTRQKTKELKIEQIDPNKTRGLTQVLRKGNQLPFH